MTCSYSGCERDAVEKTPVVNEETGVKKSVRICEMPLDKLERYNRGEDVDWSEGLT